MNKNKAFTGLSIKEYQTQQYMKDYYEANRDKLNEQMKLYQAKNKNKLKDLYKEYYDINQNKISDRRKEKYCCSCGSEIRSCDKARHEKSQKHQSTLIIEQT